MFHCLYYTEMEISCDATQNIPCYGTIGQRLFLQLITTENALRMHQEYEIRLVKEAAKIRRFLKKSPSTSLTDQRWMFFFNNGTMIINPVDRIDFGTYKVQIFLTNGTFMANNSLEFVINGTVGLNYHLL